MCGVLLTWFLGRRNNAPIGDRANDVRGSAVNTRVVNLLPLNQDREPVSVQPGDSGKQGLEGKKLGR